SFVGPRPPLRQYVERHPDLYARVLNSRPGVTGLASIVYHRHEAALLARCATPAQTDAVYSRICVPAKARLDLIYQRHQSICYDFDLVFQTIGNLLRRAR
ncbi:MAG: sugar transferase, partial [Jhaorihella sp.]